jgi:transcriptional regulator with XRE-family HTH domain
MLALKKKIKEKLREKDMTFSELANKIGISAYYLSKILDQDKIPQSIEEKIKQILEL